MNRCLITYETCGDKVYSDRGLRLLGTGLKTLKDLEYTAEEQRREAYNRASRMSVQGVQPKLSAVFNARQEKFEIVDAGGKFILKPQHQFFPEMPENEDLTMRLAAVIGLEIPFHGLIRSKDKSLTYFIKRFDRQGRKEKIPVEDFAQLAGLTRDTKYNSSMEKVVHIISEFCTFPALELIKLFKLVIFNYLVGNEDMHLKNFSVITINNQVRLSPCYDLLNTTIEYNKPVEEIALPLKGKKNKLTRNDLIKYFGSERCDLNEISINQVLKSINNALPQWDELIEKSFLSNEMKIKYKDLLTERLAILEL